MTDTATINDFEVGGIAIKNGEEFEVTYLCEPSDLHVRRLNDPDGYVECEPARNFTPKPKTPVVPTEVALGVHVKGRWQESCTGVVTEFNPDTLEVTVTRDDNGSGQQLRQHTRDWLVNEEWYATHPEEAKVETPEQPTLKFKVGDFVRPSADISQGGRPSIGVVIEDDEDVSDEHVKVQALGETDPDEYWHEPASYWDLDENAAAVAKATLKRLASQAGKVAEKAGYCSEYDRIAKELGLDPRPTRFLVPVVLTQELGFTVEAETSEEAIRKVRSMIRYQGSETIVKMATTGGDSSYRSSSVRDEGVYQIN